jgi:hypothetical protein
MPKECRGEEEAGKGSAQRFERGAGVDARLTSDEALIRWLTNTVDASLLHVLLWP